MKSILPRILPAVVPPLVLFLLVVMAWHGVVVAMNLKPFLVPRPGAVLATAWENRATLGKAMLITAAGAFGGFVSSLVVGSLVAFVFSQSRLVQRAAWPYAIFLQTVPIVAIAPLIILWFGNGFLSVVIVSFTVSLFPIVTNGTAGLTSVDRTLAELFAVNGATRWQTLVKLRIPNAVPSFVTGAKVSSGLSVIGSIIGEFFAGHANDMKGLGYLITMTSGQLKTSYLFACIIASTVLGLVIFSAVSGLGGLLTSRWRDVR